MIIGMGGVGNCPYWKKIPAPFVPVNLRLTSGITLWEALKRLQGQSDAANIRNVYRTQTIQTITNTTVETTQFNGGGAIGSKVIAANSLGVGDIIRINTKVLLSTGVNQEATQGIYFGNVKVIEAIGTLPSNLVERYAELEFDMKVLSIGENGTLCGMGRTLINSITGINTVVMRQLVTQGAVTVNTTIDNTIDLTYKWAVASLSNVCTIRASLITIIR